MIKAIPQDHNGTVYRSRTEARWAEFFALTGTQFQYEPEGFKLGSDWYVPDFFLPAAPVFFEVKPTAPNDRELRVARALTAATFTPAIIAMGNPGESSSLLWVDVTGEMARCTLVSEFKAGGVWAVEFADGGGWSVPFSSDLKNCSATGDAHPALREASRLQFQKPTPAQSAPDTEREFQQLEQAVEALMSRIRSTMRRENRA